MGDYMTEELKELMQVILSQPDYEGKINHVRALQAVIKQLEEF